MKELLTKSFWQGVKKTYDDALKGPPPEAKLIEPDSASTPTASDASNGTPSHPDTP